MTVTIQNVDETLLNFIQSAINLRPQNNYNLLKSDDCDDAEEIKKRKKEQIIKDIKKDIELFNEGKLKTYPHGENWKYLK